MVGTLQLAVARLRKRHRIGYVANGTGKLQRLVLLSLMSTSAAEQEEGGSKKKRRWWVRPMFRDHDTHGAWNALIPTLRDEDPDLFYNFMRMWPEHFDELLSKVSPFIKKTSWRKSISPGERLAITLRKLATRESDISLQYLFRVSNQAISNIVPETCHVIWRVLSADPEIFEPPSTEMWLRVASEFKAMWDYPNCLGAADGVHIHAKAFSRTGSLFFNYKKRFSISVLAVADAKQKFLVVEAGSCGSNGDAGIYLRSDFLKGIGSGKLHIPPPIPVDGMEGDIPFMFVGDNAYPRSTFMQTPFRGHFLKPEEIVFNYRLSRARRSVENAFGILQKRYEILQGAIEGSYDKVKSVILACFSLHNFHLQREESLPPGRRKYRPVGCVEYWREDGSSVPGRWRLEKPIEARKYYGLSKTAVRNAYEAEEEEEDIDAEALREKLVEYFIDYDVPWQWKQLNFL